MWGPRLFVLDRSFNKSSKPIKLGNFMQQTIRSTSMGHSSNGENFGNKNYKSHKYIFTYLVDVLPALTLLDLS